MEEPGAQSQTLSKTATTALHLIRLPQALKNFDERSLKNEGEQPDITDFYNYGFNYYTLHCYLNKLKYVREGLAQDRFYPLNLNRLTKMNDQIPMDLGGLGNFLDPSLLENEMLANLDSENLLRVLLQAYDKDKNHLKSMMFHMNANTINDPFCKILQNITKNIDQKNRESLRLQGHTVYDNLYLLKTMPFKALKIQAEAESRERSERKRAKKEKKEKKDKKDKKQKKEKRKKEEEEGRQRSRKRSSSRRRDGKERSRSNRRRSDSDHSADNRRHRRQSDRRRSRSWNREDQRKGARERHRTRSREKEGRREWDRRGYRESETVQRRGREREDGRERRPQVRGDKNKKSSDYLSSQLNSLLQGI